jgi:hypothetical protein
VRIGAPPFCQLLLEAVVALSPDEPEGFEEPDELSEDDEEDDEELSPVVEEDPLSPEEPEVELLFEPRASFL